MGNLLGLWLAPEQDFPCSICRLCASTLSTFDAFRERTAECDQAIKQVRKVNEISPLESIKVELLEDDDTGNNGSDREEGSLVIDEPADPMNESEEADGNPPEEVTAASPIAPTGPVWVPVENAKPKRSARLVCMECETTFSCHQTLAKHQRRFHGNPEPLPSTPQKKSRKGKTRHYSCGQCSAIFYGYGAALTHLAQAHKKTEEPPAETITGDVEPEPATNEPEPTPPQTPRIKITPSPKKTLQCKQCNKTFLYMRSLDTHMRTACKVPMIQAPESVVSISPKEHLHQRLSETAHGAAKAEHTRTAVGFSRGSCFRCGICNEVIKGSKAFLSHRRNVHGWTPPSER